MVKKNDNNINKYNGTYIIGIFMFLGFFSFIVNSFFLILMNNRVTRFFQGLSLTTFSMAVYNTINGLKARTNVKEQQDTLSSIATEVKSNAAGQKIWQESIREKIDLLKKSDISKEQVEMIEKAEKDLKSDITGYEEISRRLSDDESVKNLSYEETIKVYDLLKTKADSIASGSGKNTLDVLNKVLEEIRKGSGGGGSKYISDVSDFLSSLTFEQTVAILNITGCIAIIISLISLIIIFYGNIFIDSLQLEIRYPRIARFIQ